ncbi:MAG: polysaccharide pyruvyl transferase family protein [Synechococcaceae cyanobacterium]
MEAFPERLDLYGQALARWLIARGPLRLIVRMPGNIGDHLIWRGCCDLFERHGVHAERIDHRQALDAPHPDATLVIPGSGALTRLWHEWLPALIQRAAAQYRNVVVLASDYDPDVPEVAEALALPNVWAIARQPLSYAAIRPFGRAVLLPDPALWCRRFHGRSTALAAPAVPTALADPTADGPLLLALRTDRGSSLAHLPLGPAPEHNRDLSRIAPDLDAFLDAVEAAAVVVTDRLHIAVSAVMFGKQLRWIDPYDRKISAYLAFAFDDSQRARCAPIDTDELLARGWVLPQEG